MPDQNDTIAQGPSAADLAMQGMNQAAEHADAEIPGWTHQAFDMLKLFAARHFEFMGEDVRKWAHDEGFPQPPDRRAWGHVIQRGVRDGVGYRKTRIPPAHATPRAIWRSRIWHEEAANG